MMQKLRNILEGCLFTDGDWIESKDQDPEGKIRLIQLADIGDGEFVDKSSRFMNQETATALNCTYLKTGDILIARMPDPLGRACIFPLKGEKKFVTAVDVCIIRNGENIDNKYLKYAINSPFIRHDISRQSTGTTRKRITRKKLGELLLPLPPLEEQTKIAAILDAADGLRQKDKALITKYDDLTQSLFLDMFGDPISNPKGWKMVPMGRLMKIVRGGSPRPINKYLGGIYPWIKIGDGTKGNDIYLTDTKEHITAEGLNKTRLLPSGSLIFANCGVSLGFARIITFEGCIHDGWLAFSEIDENVLNKLFLLKTLNSITLHFRRTAPDGTQPNLNTSIMKNFKLILPDIALQTEFSDRLESLRKQKEIAQRSLKKAEALFNNLLQKAFKGELTN